MLIRRKSGLLALGFALLLTLALVAPAVADPVSKPGGPYAPPAQG